MPLIIPGNSQASTGYTIDQSIRFNPSDNTYMHRTQDTADSKRKLSLSWWMKRGSSFGTELCLFAAGASSRFMARMHSDNKLTLRLTNGTTEKTMTTDMVFRDPGAWYHCLWVADCTNGVSSDFSVLYVNGARVTMTGTQPSANTDFAGYGDGSTFSISTNSHSLSSQEWDGYLAEMVLIDNQALDPSSFGEYNSSNIWVPKDVSGLTFGTNGFYVDGRDSSDLGDDESGNGNDFSTNGLAAHDQVLDSPTNNFCVMNAIENVPCNFSEGNLTIDSTSNFSGAAIRGNIHIKGGSTGKWYYEVVGSLTGDYFSTGWMLSSIITPGSTVIGQDVGSVAFYNTGSYQNTTNAQGAITKPAAGDVIGVGLDASTGQVFLRDDSGWYVGTLSSNALSSGVVITGFSGEDLVMASRNSSSGTATYNFGQDGTFAGAKTAQGNTDANGIGNFFYTVPDDFLAICTKNLGAE